MRVISRPALLEFAEVHADAREELDAWWAIATRADWKTPGDIRLTYTDADSVAGVLIVFNIAHNKYRLIVSADFERATFFVYGVYTHADYDRLDLAAIARGLKAEQDAARARRAAGEGAGGRPDQPKPRHRR